MTSVKARVPIVGIDSLNSFVGVLVRSRYLHVSRSRSAWRQLFKNSKPKREKKQLSCYVLYGCRFLNEL